MRLNHSLVAVLALGLAWLAAPASAAMFKGDAALSGVYAGPSPMALHGVRFTFQAGGPIRSTPALVDGVLYFGSSDGNLYAIDASDGQERWRLKTGGAVTSSPAVVDGAVFFASRDSKLYAADAASGAVLWTFDLGRDLGPQNYWDYYQSSPTPSGANVYVGSGDGHVYAVDRATGREIWRFDAGARVRATPAVAGGLVVFGTMSGHVIALDAASGARRWDFATKGASNKFSDVDNDTTSVFASPSIAHGVVTIGGRDGFLYGVNLKTGAQMWRTTHDGSSWVLSTATADGRVYSGSGSAFFVQAADLKTGAERWRFVTAGANFGAVTLVGGVLLADDFAGNLYAVDRASGKELWRFALGDRALAAPMAGAGIVYASSDSGVLYALDTAPTPPTAAPEVKRLVYWDGKTGKDAFRWFQNDIDGAILNYFRSAGYAQVDAAQLRQAMLDQVGGTGRSVVVFADNRVPAGVLDADDEHALIRRYLDAGGRVAVLGTNPAALKLDPVTGELTAFDYDRAGKIFGIAYPPHNIDRGYHVSEVTADGVVWGLRGMFVDSEAIDPKEASLVLAHDEFGMASEWVKTYGKGGVLLQLAVPRNALGSLVQYRLAIEHALR